MFLWEIKFLVWKCHLQAFDDSFRKDFRTHIATCNEWHQTCIFLCFNILTISGGKLIITIDWIQPRWPSLEIRIGIRRQMSWKTDFIKDQIQFIKIYFPNGHIFFIFSIFFLRELIGIFERRVWSSGPLFCNKLACRDTSCLVILVKCFGVAKNQFNVMLMSKNWWMLYIVFHYEVKIS